MSSGEDTAVRLPEDYMPRGAPIDSPAALVTREFGHQSERFHKGMDFSAPKGCPVKATAPGTVVFAGRYKAYGRLVVVRHGTQYDTWYGHLKRIRTRDGAYVRRGETIGTLGESGNATGPHVHYEVHYRGELVDPKGFL